MDNRLERLEFGEEFLLESAEKRYESGDYLGALTMLNKRARRYEPSADACALYADIYEALELYPLCADAWFRFLDTCNEADFAEGFEGLSIAFMNMGDSFRSELYFRRAYDGELPETEPEPEEETRPPLRVVHSADGGIESSEQLLEGLELLKCGELAAAKETFSDIPPESRDFPSASGLVAMCRLLEGDIDGAAEECERLLSHCPDNVHALTTYCAVLGAKGDTEGAKEIGRRLAATETKSTEDLFRVATALCETGLDKEAYEALSRLREKLPYGEDVLWFSAVACYRTGHLDEAISVLERLTTVYPRKAVAEYYLVRMRRQRDGLEEEFPITYFYHVPEEEGATIRSFFRAALAAKREEAELFAGMEEMKEYFRLAFDQFDGRDTKLQELAVQVAERCRCDGFLREMLLDYNVGEDVKIPVLHSLALRNEDNSFGVVVCGLYRELFFHKLELGRRKRMPFLQAFADVYSKYALLGEENESKIVLAAEDLYKTLEEAEALEFADEREAIAAVIYREARIRRGERSIGRIADMFDAELSLVKEILNYMI